MPNSISTESSFYGTPLEKTSLEESQNTFNATFLRLRERFPTKPIVDVYHLAKWELEREGKGRKKEYGREKTSDDGRKKKTRELGRDAEQHGGREVGREVGTDVGRDIGRDVGRNVGRDVGRDVRREAVVHVKGYANSKKVLRGWFRLKPFENAYSVGVKILKDGVQEGWVDGLEATAVYEFLLKHPHSLDGEVIDSAITCAKPPSVELREWEAFRRGLGQR